MECYPLTDNIDEFIDKRIEDKERIDFLKRYGFNVIVIWNHDIDNGNYKKILKKLKEEIRY
jgi:very-short-patch-repair endonuclease